MNDSVSIWVVTSKKFDNIRTQIENTLNVISSGASFKLNQPITPVFTNWIEAKEIRARKNMVGIIIKGPVPPHYPQRSSKNSCWKKSARLYDHLYKGVGNNNHVYALNDYRSALLEKGPNFIIFAYRAIEDICRAVTGSDYVGENEWNQMHKILKTSKKMIDPLRTLSESVRHGAMGRADVKKSNAKRQQLILIARKVLEKELYRTFPNFK